MSSSPESQDREPADNGEGSPRGPGKDPPKPPTGDREPIVGPAEGRKGAAAEEPPGPGPDDGSAVWSMTGLEGIGAKPREERGAVLETLDQDPARIGYRCQDRRLNRLVAFWRLLSDDPQRIERFRDDVLAMAQLSHPNPPAY